MDVEYSLEAGSALSTIVAEYRATSNIGVLLDQVRALAARVPTSDLKEAVTPFRDMPEVVIPAYERIVAERPSDAQAMVVLGNAYWLTGRGPDVVGALASRAIDADDGNRGAWHLWALSEPEIRARVERWQRVVERFPWDQLARAALADNAASLAGAEHDAEALDLAIESYETLLNEATNPEQRTVLETTLSTLRSWRL
jgi:hypothetical protein